VPPILGMLSPGVTVAMFRNAKTGMLTINVPTGDFDRRSRQAEGRLILPMGGLPAQGPMSSRFFAKVTVESREDQGLCAALGLGMIIDDRR